MTASPRRVPPADPRDIALTYQHRHPWWFDADTAPEAWHVSADIYDDSGTHVEAHVGDFLIVAVDVDQVRDPFGLLDGEDADLGLIAETIFGGGDLDPDLDSLLEPAGSRILILSSARLEPGWRGFGLGALLTGTALRRLAAGGRAAVCYPAPIGDASEEEPTGAAREQAVQALDRVWAQLGFEHFRDGIHVLDLNLATLDENLARLRKAAQRYQARRLSRGQGEPRVPSGNARALTVRGRETPRTGTCPIKADTRAAVAAG
jgi:GNAT superfamily N-acetyltransferase